MQPTFIVMISNDPIFYIHGDIILVIADNKTSVCSINDESMERRQQDIITAGSFIDWTPRWMN